MYQPLKGRRQVDCTHMRQLQRNKVQLILRQVEFVRTVG
ncbi:hypothetical protein DAI22_01g335150 [Oryza sativa Japonica Group]|nr:hypothetical protein DAI22_01g335150 [Oryza sativa Japonica Group]